MQSWRVHASLNVAGPSVLSAKQLMALLPDHIKRLLRGQQTSPHGLPKPMKIGVCVSGGADSMILSYLLKHAKHPLSPLTAAFEPYAFIVDHRARPQSEDEALSVRSLLSEMNVQSHILTMLWSREVDFGSMKDFEKLARRKRYRLIAEAALSQNIRYLFTGHHGDDQIETLLSRLVRDQQLLKSSFLGISELSPIPECEDVFGARPTSDVFANLLSDPDHIQDAETSNTEHQNVSNESRAGLQLVRPLLTVPKHSLLATCVHNDVSFVNDPTNFDPTITVRNAIRYLRSNYQLPYALSGESLLRLRHQAAVNHDKAVQQARHVALQCRLHHVSNDGLYLAFELPSSYSTLPELDISGFAYFLGRVAELVSPLPSSRIPSTLDEIFVRRFLHKCRPSERGGLLNICGVIFHITNGTSAKNGGFINVVVFREPPRQAEMKRLRCDLCPVTEVKRESSSSTYTTRWLLWDNRIWIRALSPVATELQNLRIISSADIYKTTHDLRGRDIDYAKSLLKTLPEKARGSVPILSRGPRIIGLPTFGKQPYAINTHNVDFEVAYPIRERCQDLFEFPIRKNDKAIPWNRN